MRLSKSRGKTENMSYHVTYKLTKPAVSTFGQNQMERDRMAPIRTMNRIAQVACARILLLMNNTNLIKEHRLTNMDQVLVYLRGLHDDVGLSGDRGDFYKRKLAEQIALAFAIDGVSHNNVDIIVETAIGLERKTRQIIMNSALNPGCVPPVDVPEDVLDILSRIAEIF